MSWLRAVIRRWLGIPERREIRSQILREIDADAIWRGDGDGRTFAAQADDLARERRVAIALGQREDTRRG